MTAKLITAVALGVVCAGAALAQTPSSGQKTLAATLNVYVFPTTGQTPQQQATDEAACYSYAVQNVGTDPFALQKQAQQQAQQTAQAQQQAQQAGQGAGARGALGGAAAGALIGSISGRAGEGAAIGAATGALVGGHRRREARAQASQQAAEQGAQMQQATAQQVENFKKAFSVCLEAKKYMVKY